MDKEADVCSTICRANKEVNVEEVFIVTGDLDFSNIMMIYKKSLNLLLHCNVCVFDFSRLKSSNSAGIALVIEWIKLAKQNKKTVVFKNLPDKLLSIAKMASLDTVILRPKGEVSDPSLRSG